MTHITAFSGEHEHWRNCALCEHLVVAVKPTGLEKDPRLRKDRFGLILCLQANQPQQNKINCNAKKNQRSKTKVQIMLINFPQLSLCHLPDLVRSSVLVQTGQLFIHAIPAWSGAGALWPVLCWWICAALFPNNGKISKGTAS